MRGIFIRAQEIDILPRKDQSQKNLMIKLFLFPMTGQTTWILLKISEYADFLSIELKNVSYAKEIVASGGFKEKLEVWTSHDDTDISELSSTHKEPDTRITLHTISSNCKYIVVSSKDRDVLVFMFKHTVWSTTLHGIYLNVSHILF